MALIDVAPLIIDPDFCDRFTLIKRSATINQYGEMVLSETPQSIIGVVQNVSPEVLKRFPDDAQLWDGITVWYRGRLEAQSPNGYCDVILWNGYRYLVKFVNEQFMNYGSGWTEALCAKEVAHA